MKHRLRQVADHDTDRTETFSDGVFAVAITLLALDLVHIRATPGVGDGTMLGAIRVLWPSLLAFAASFAFIGVTWLNHHSHFKRLRLMNRSVSAANLFLLAACVLVPWSNSALAVALTVPGGGKQEVLVYSIVLGLNAVAWFFLISAIASHPELLKDPADAKGISRDRYSALTGIVSAIVATIVAYVWSPVAATALLFSMSIFYFVVAPGFENTEQADAPADVQQEG